MDETVDLQGHAIGVGTLVAICLLAYGTVVSDTIAGYEAFTLALWVFAATFGAVTLLHLRFGRADVALAFGGATVGWVLVLLGDSGASIGLGLLLLALGGIYVARLTPAGREGDASEESEGRGDR